MSSPITVQLTNAQRLTLLNLVEGEIVRLHSLIKITPLERSHATAELLALRGVISGRITEVASV